MSSPTRSDALTASPVANDYPWYALVEGADLLQGDFLDQCPILIPPDDFQIPVLGEPTEIRVELRTYDVVIMSQSCDLEQEKLDLVLVCPHWSLERLANDNDFFKSSAGKEQLRRGNVPGYHLLAPCELSEAKRDIQVVDFRSVYSLPYKFVKSFATRGGKRLRLLPPYREHLSQAFARFFMRVGLPVDIPPFRK
jgi:hypothetical protein